MYLLKYKYKLHDDIIIIIQWFTFYLHDLLLDIDYVRILMTQKYRFQYKDFSFSLDEINQRNCRRVVFQLSEESVMQIERSITAATKRHDEFKTNIRAMKTKRERGCNLNFSR